MISLKNVSFSYGNNVIFNDANIHVGRGEVIGVVGPNGAGKTTFFDILMGILKPDSGQVEVYCEPEEKSYLLQYMNFPPILKMREIAELAVAFQGGPNGSVEDMVGAWDERVRERYRRIENRRFGVCSYGERRWLSALLALSVGSKKLLVLDEPTAGVDPEFRFLFWRHLKEMKLDEKIVLVSSHSLDELQFYVDRFFFIGEHRFLEFKNVDNFLSTYEANDFDTAFIRAAGVM